MNTFIIFAVLNDMLTWLSPAYDINTPLSDSQSLPINRPTSGSDLNIPMESAGDYMPTEEKAGRLGLPRRDIATFAPRFDKWL